jgi:hypothetical protein
MYTLLKISKEQEEHCNIPLLQKDGEAVLEMWVSTQRQLKKKGKLDPGRQKSLEEIGFEWVLPSATWDKMFALLNQFKKREGHCNAPTSHKEDSANLGVWVSRQRQLNKKGKLDPEREKRLEAVGFEWVLVLPSATWDKTFALLQQFKKREGHCNVPQLHKEDEVNLGVWVSTQRHLKTKGKLDPEREKRLETIGFEWVFMLPSATWDKRFALLQQFKEREGHSSVPQSHTEDGADLGVWVSRQRQLKKKEKLDPDRKKRLEAIFFEWVFVLPSAPWDKTLALLQQFKKREGHCNVPQSHKEDQANLGIWVNDQRQLKKKEKLDPEREKRLEEIGFEWVLPSATWDKMFALLRQYKRREGHCIVPQSHKEDGANLGTWVTAQRHLEKSGKLVPDRQQLLDDFGFKWARQPKAP